MFWKGGCALLMFSTLLSANAEKPPVYTILFAGNNFQRLLWGLFVTLRVSLIGYSFRAFHEKKGSRKSWNQPALSGLYPDYAAAGFTVFGLLRYGKNCRLSSFRRGLRHSGIYPLGNGGNGRSGSSGYRQHSQAPKGKRQESWPELLADLSLLFPKP